MKITIWTLKQNIVENIVFLKINEPGVPNIGHVGRKKIRNKIKTCSIFFFDVRINYLLHSLRKNRGQGLFLRVNSRFESAF